MMMVILEDYHCQGPNQPNNFTHGKEYLQDKQLESDITFHVGKQEAELALTVNNVVFNRDLYQLKGLIRARADPNKTDYDGRSPLHLAASRGYEDITLFLMQEHVDVNIKDNFGNTPLLEAIKNGHDRVAHFFFFYTSSFPIVSPNHHGPNFTHMLFFF